MFIIMQTLVYFRKKRKDTHVVEIRLFWGLYFEIKDARNKNKFRLNGFENISDVGIENIIVSVVNKPIII